MFDNKTVFVLGAGASRECGMPLGAALKSKVADDLRFRYSDDRQSFEGDYELYEFLKRKYGANQNKYVQAAKEFSKASRDFESIDDALHFFSGRPEIVELGKVAIVRNILQAELESNLQIDRHTGKPDLDRLKSTWYREVFSIAIAGSKKEEISRIFDNLTFVNFNYDRTLEYFCFHALVDSIGIERAQAADIIEQHLRVIRPYGVVGRMDSVHAFNAPLGGDIVSESLWALSRGIRTFTEAHQAEMEDKISDALDSAELVLFLGFCFHGQNVKLLMPKDRGARGRITHRLFVTAKDVHPKNIETLSGQLEAMFVWPPTRILDMSAYEFMLTQRISIEAFARKSI